MPTLHRTWLTVVGRLIAVILGLGVVALVATQYQRATFAQTTSKLEGESRTIVLLNRGLQDVSDVATSVLYLSGDKRDEGVRRYGVLRKTVDAAFDDAEAAFAGQPGYSSLERARARWHAIDHTMSTAADLWATSDVSDILTTGVDPYANTVWTPYSKLTKDLTDVQTSAVGNLHRDVERATRGQAVVVFVVVGAVVLALIVGVLSGRRMSRRVLIPIMRIREAALGMRDVGGEAALDVSGAVRELHELAETLVDTAHSLHASHQELHDQAHTDSLTGLANRAAFLDHVSGAVANGNGRVGALFIDLDDFKEVNDTLGHAAGDRLLQVVGERLRAATREGELVARLGGDEFAIALSEVTDPRALVAVAERTLQGLDAPVAIEGSSVRVGCSIGLALAEPGEAPSQLLGNADFAMYMAKSQGKRRFEVFAPSMHEEMLGQIELKRELATAAELGQLVLHYQPVVDLDSGNLIGLEALVRWEHPTRGLLPPADFIALAERTGDIVAIGAWTLDRACADLAAVHAATDAARPWVSVNVSASQLIGAEFVDCVTETLERHGLDGDHLVLEITERMALTNAAAAAKVLGDVRALGVHVALDDFGVGFSSLRSLHDLPVDVLKIDQSFVTRPSRDSDSMLRAIVTMAASLDLAVIAEGIELPDQLDRVRAMGAHVGQGFLLAAPEPLEDALAAFDALHPRS